MALHVLHDFTTDSSLLLKQLARRNGSQLPETAVSGGSSFNSDTDPVAVAFNAWLSGTGVSKEESEFYRVNPATGTYRAVQFIANHLAGLRGRKNLIWVSGGFPTEAVRALEHANVAIYPWTRGVSLLISALPRRAGRPPLIPRTRDSPSRWARSKR